MATIVDANKELPITERANELTDKLDVATPLGMVRLLRGCDAQIFSGYRSYISLADVSIRNVMKKVSLAAKDIILSNNGVVVMSGSGTSGRIAFLVARNLNQVLLANGLRPCFKYLCSGGDSALLLSDELPEDDTVGAVKDLLAASSNQKEGDVVMVVGITCGVSAPYVAGQIDFVLDMCEGNKDDDFKAWSEANGVTLPTSLPSYVAVLVGFNPVRLARGATIEMWRNRPSSKSRTMLDVATRLQKATATSSSKSRQHFIINPVVGPEAVCASSRMKGGSVTKVILDACFGSAVSDATTLPLLCSSRNSIRSTDCDHYVDNIISTMEETYHRTYLAAENISKLLQGCGKSIGNKGHVYYLGKESAGILGFVDASEMPDTYGAAFTEFRGFCSGGWVGACAVEGDISERGSLYRISIKQFLVDVFPTLTENDTVIALHSSRGSKNIAEDQYIDELTMRAKKEKNIFACRVQCGTKDDIDATKSNLFNVDCIALLECPEIFQGYTGYSQFSLKLILNAISTGAQVMKGMVCRNHMINTGPTNNKIYHRCIRLISMFANVDEDKARTALWKAIYHVDDLSTIDGDVPVEKRQISDHIKVATPSDDSDKEKEQKVLPLAILLGAGMTIQEALDAIAKYKIVNKAIDAVAKTSK
jgi:N-acetylmuramic acid 6-phosphate (MurNAc-6-P) etherase